MKSLNVKRIIKRVCTLFFLVFVVTSIILSVSIFKLNMLPNKYFLLINGCLLILACFIFLFVRGKKKKINLLGGLLSIIFSILFIIISLFVIKTHSTLKNFFTKGEEKITYEIVVFNEKEYTSINDLKELHVGILRENSVNMKSYLEEQKILVNIYNTLGELTLSLGTENEAIIVNVDMLTTISELDVEFNNKIKSIGKFELNLGEDIPYEEPEEEIPEVPEKTEEQIRFEQELARRKEELSNLKKGNSFVVYITGIDASGGNSASNAGLSDVNMLAIVNPDTNNLLLVSIPRDYYVYVNGRKDKLTHAGLYGVNTSIRAVENIFNVKIDYYVKVCFGAVTTLVDDIDGIEVYSDTAFNSYHIPGWWVPQGTIQLDGKKALAYARERYAYTSGDRHRIKNQQDVIDAIVKKVSKNTGYLMKFNDILNDINPYFDTNFPYDKMQSFVKKQIDTLSGWNVTKYSVDGSNSYGYSASFPNSPAYIMIPNYDTIFAAQDKILNVIRG